ncbi:class I SAM-dependent methyltransferase [Nanoarchaeota archaeon]
MNPVQIFYNSPYFENLQETPPFLDYLAKEEQELRRVISGGKVLDIGCGSGRSTAILSGVADEVVGIDFSERLLGKARERLQGQENARLYLEDAKSTHFDADTFDFVVMTWNLFGNLYSTRDKVLEESKRVVKPDGEIFLSVFSENVLPPYLEMLEQNGLIADHYDENYVFLREGLVSERFSPDKLERILNKAKLTGKIKSLTNISYWVEAIKKV